VLLVRSDGQWLRNRLGGPQGTWPIAISHSRQSLTAQMLARPREMLRFMLRMGGSRFPESNALTYCLPPARANLMSGMGGKRTLESMCNSHRWPADAKRL
jgi:hypothetical protein